MTTPLVIQIFITLAALLLGGILVDLYHWLRERRAAVRPMTSVPIPPSPTAVSSVPPTPAPTQVVIPDGLEEKLIAQTQADYQAALSQSAGQFQGDLAATSELVNGQIRNLATSIISDELEKYREELIKVREESIAGMGQLQTAIADERKTMEAQLAEEIKAEKDRLMAQIDHKLGDAIGSFLTETLQHNIDLGAQSAYLTAMLEEHKAELKKELSDEV